MKSERRRAERLFVVRLWREAGAPDCAALRGGVEDVTGGQRLFFSDLADLNEFLRRRLDTPDDPAGFHRTRSHMPV
jgi:hypothetical protein